MAAKKAKKALEMARKAKDLAEKSKSFARLKKGALAVKKAGQAAKRKGDEAAKQSDKNPEEMEPSGKYAKEGDPDDNMFEAMVKSYVDPRNTVAYEDARDKSQFVQKGELTTYSGDKRSITNPLKSKDEFDTSDKDFITTSSGKKMSFDEYSGQQYQPYRRSAKEAKEIFTYVQQQKRREKSQDQKLVESVVKPV